MTIASTRSPNRQQTHFKYFFCKCAYIFLIKAQLSKTLDQARTYWTSFQ